VWRLNIGVSKETFDSLFPGDNSTHDFTALDRLIPHPIYGRNHWVSVLNPSDATFASLRPLLDEAYRIAADRATRQKERQ
jgi:predicted DNA-binding protein (MmcQ/YjbR family)